MVIGLLDEQPRGLHPQGEFHGTLTQRKPPCAPVERLPGVSLRERNLLIHIMAVPIFLTANVGLVLSLLRGAWAAAAVAAALMGAALSVQGRGHQMEPTPAEPFTGPLNVLARLFAEQWITFPRFVLTGRWLEALRRQATAHRPSRQVLRSILA